MAIEVNVDPELCIGSSDCARVAPAAFHLEEDRGVSVAVAAGVASTDEQLLIQAARGCPTQAISVVRDGIVVHGSK